MYKRIYGFFLTGDKMVITRDGAIVGSLPGHTGGRFLGLIEEQEKRFRQKRCGRQTADRQIDHYLEGAVLLAHGLCKQLLLTEVGRVVYLGLVTDEAGREWEALWGPADPFGVSAAQRDPRIQKLLEGSWGPVEE